MPKGRHKGQSRRFTSFEELEADRKREERTRQGLPAIDGDEPQNGEATTSSGLTAASSREKKEDDDEAEEEEEEDDEDDDEPQRRKGVGHLIAVSNPNRVSSKPKKASEIGTGSQVNRKDREKLEIDRLKQMAERKQVEADLARLAIVRKQREEEERRLAEQRRLKELKAAQSSKR